MAVGDRIPKENRKDLKDVFLYVKARLPNPPIRHLEYLFEAYNKFIEPHNKKDIGCRTQVATVLNVFNDCTSVVNSFSWVGEATSLISLRHSFKSSTPYFKALIFVISSLR